METVILSHSGVAECGVVGTPDELAGELPTAFVVRKPGSALTENELLHFTDAKVIIVFTVAFITYILTTLISNIFKNLSNIPNSA